MEKTILLTLFIAINLVKIGGAADITAGNCNFDKLQGDVSTSLCGYTTPFKQFGSFLKKSAGFLRIAGDFKNKNRSFQDNDRPYGDHTSGKGAYMTVDQSFLYPRIPVGTEFYLETPNLRSKKPFCLKFWFFSFHNDQLGVLTRINGVKTRVWGQPKYGFFDKRQPWGVAEVDLPGYADQFQVVFQAVKTDGKIIAVAIDDVSFNHGPCNQRHSKAVTEKSTDHNSSQAVATPSSSPNATNNRCLSIITNTAQIPQKTTSQPVKPIAAIMTTLKHTKTTQQLTTQPEVTRQLTVSQPTTQQPTTTQRSTTQQPLPATSPDRISTTTDQTKSNTRQTMRTASSLNQNSSFSSTHPTIEKNSTRVMTRTTGTEKSKTSFGVFTWGKISSGLQESTTVTIDTLQKVSTRTYNLTIETQGPQTVHPTSSSSTTGLLVSTAEGFTNSTSSTIPTAIPCVEARPAGVYCPSDMNVTLSAPNTLVNMSVPQPYADKKLTCVSCPTSIHTLVEGNHKMRFVYTDIRTNDTAECSYMIHVLRTQPVCQNTTTNIYLNRDQTQTDVITIENTGVKIRLTAGVHEIQIADRCYHQYVVNDWSNIERRTVIQAEYKIECRKLNKASYSIIQVNLLQNTLLLQKYCIGCKLDGSVPHFSCSNQMLIVTWNTGVTGGQRVSESTLHESLQSDLSQFQKRYSQLVITVIDTIPRIVSPVYDKSGSFLKVYVTTSCLDEGFKYNRELDRCDRYCSIV